MDLTNYKHNPSILSLIGKTLSHSHREIPSKYSRELSGRGKKILVDTFKIEIQYDKPPGYRV